MADDIIKDAASLAGWDIDAEDAVRALGTVECDHGAPLTVGVYRGHVNIAGRMLGQPAQEEFARLFVAACWEAGHHDGYHGSQSREVPGE